MSGYNAFDQRLESLVVETRTLWESELMSLSATEKREIAQAIQSRPELASKIAYERTHTGFIREITVSADDVKRLQFPTNPTEGNN